LLISDPAREPVVTAMPSTNGGRLSEAWRLRSLPLLAASLVVIAAITARWIMSGSSTGSLTLGAPTGIVSSVSEVLADATCRTADDARSRLRERLDVLGYRDWMISSRHDLKPGGCVAAAINATSKTILLVPALRPEVRTMLEAITDHLFDDCLAKDPAIEYLTSTLATLGEADAQVRTDGPLAYPVNRADEVKKHLVDGCWIYSGTGWTDDGQRIYYLSGGKATGTNEERQP
jgi:hypothetical protein